MLDFHQGWEPLDYLHDSCLRVTCDGEGGATSGRGFGMSGIMTVGDKQVNGQGAVVAESFEAATFLCHFSELLFTPIPVLVRAGLGVLVDMVRGLPDFAGVVVKTDFLA